MKYILIIIGLVFGQAIYAFGQQTISDRTREIDFYKKSLDVDSIKASQVYDIIHTYKSEMKKISADGIIKTDLKREKIKELIDEKNLKLKSILSVEQQLKLIPTSSVSRKSN